MHGLIIIGKYTCTNPHPCRWKICTHPLTLISPSLENMCAPSRQFAMIYKHTILYYISKFTYVATLSPEGNYGVLCQLKLIRLVLFSSCKFLRFNIYV